MAMFGNLLKRKKPTVEVPANFGMDKSQLNRRMGNVLARSTRHELKAPSLVPDEELMAGSAMIGSDTPVNAAAMAREAARQAVEAPDLSSQDQPTSDYASDSPAEAEAAPAMAMPVHESAAPVAEPASADISMEALRAKLKASLSALRDGEPGMEAAQEPLAELGEPAPVAPVAASEDENAQLTLAAPEAYEVEPDSVDAMAAPEAIIVPPLAAEPEPFEMASQDDHLEAGEPEQPWTADDTVHIEDEAHVPGETFEADEEAPEAAVNIKAEPLASEPVELALESVAEPASDAGTVSVGAASLAPITAIYLTHEAVACGQPEAASDLVVQVTDYLMYDAGYYPEELPVNGVRAWCMDFYVKNVLEGGFGAFVYNAHGQPEIWEACAAGMEAAGAVEHLDILDALRNLLAHDAALAVALGDDASAGHGHPDLAALEGEFAAQEARAPLARSAGHWLASLPEIEMVGEEELQSIVTGLGEHPDLAARRQQNG